MDLQQIEHSEATVNVQNIGGVEETTVEFSPGVTILEGRNATNRTSFLQAVIAALGGDNVSVKGDAAEARVELTLGDEAYTRDLNRRSGGVSFSGDPYLDDAEVAELFAFLLESNEVRRAVATNADLRELIMRPVDTEEIQAELDRLVQQRQTLDEQLDEIEELKGVLPGLEEKRTRLQNKIEEKQAEIEEKEAELESADVDVEETREEKSELEDKLDELQSKRSKLDDIRYDLETERESKGALEQDRRELETEQAELPEAPMGEIEELDAEIRRLREQKQHLETEVNELQSVIGFNEEMLGDAETTLTQLADSDEGAVTDQLLDDGEVTCWTCGTDVEEAQIESTMSQLKELSQTKVSKVNDIEQELDELREDKHELEQAQGDRDRIEQRLDDLEREIGQTEDTIEDLQARRETLTEEIETVEAEVNELESEDYSTILDLHKEANQLEYELGKIETDLERVESEISDIEDEIADQSDLEAEREAVTAEIESLRTKIERIEQGAVEEFNEHMETILGLLDYENLDRIWIEQVEQEVREGRKKVSTSVFELHVIRMSASGAAYEDTVDHLSESEREVTGLVFALAGYLAHEVYEEVPFMLLDSLEAIDSERIAALVEYLTDYTGYLLVALLPEDATALPDDYARITEI